jgi:glutamate synthase (NADPH/NADH) small chain
MMSTVSAPPVSLKQAEVRREFPGSDRKTRMRLLFQGLPSRLPTERVHDFNEAVLPFTPEQARAEAMRCLHCPDPAPCYKACPAHNDISQAVWLIEQGEFNQAAEVYRKTNCLSQVCGRVCPHEKLCEGACVRTKVDGPVLTGALEAFVADYDRQTRGIKIPVGESTGKKVAIVGAGPAGISCAYHLLRLGHWVTIFDAKPIPGGLLVYGIPNFKLPKSIVLDIWQDLMEAGLTFVGNTYVGRTRTVNDLFNEGFDAVFIGTGAGRDIPMGVDGENLPGVYKGTEFLIRANTDPKLLPPDLLGTPEVGRRVAVIGGGDTASDCLRTALRMGAEEVICLYRRTEAEMPGGYHDRLMAREEGAKYQFLTQPVRFFPGIDGRLATIECIRMELGEPDAKGRRRPVPIEGSNFHVPADTAILALGYQPDPIISATTPGLRTHNWGLIVTDHETGTTSRMGVFAGGDVATGPDLVVTAMVAGRKAASTIDAYLY